MAAAAPTAATTAAAADAANVGEKKEAYAHSSYSGCFSYSYSNSYSYSYSSTRLWCWGICLKSPLRFCLCRSQPSFVIQKFLALHSVYYSCPVPLFIYFICLISFHFVSFHLVSCLTYADSVRKALLDFFAYSLLFSSFALEDPAKCIQFWPPEFPKTSLEFLPLRWRGRISGMPCGYGHVGNKTN